MTFTLPTNTRDLTEVLDEEVTAALSQIMEVAEEIFPEGLPGDLKLTGKAEMNSITAMITSLPDMMLLLDPGWEERIRNNEDVPPQSPRLLNLLRVPGLLTKTSQRYNSLVKRYAEDAANEGTQGGAGVGRQVDNVPGVALPVAQGAPSYAP